MKRTYTKPLIAMESFQLNAEIAGACRDKNLPEQNILNHYQSTCTLMEESGEVYFGKACEENGGINVKLPSFTDEGGLCYHGPFDPDVVYLAS